MRQAFSASDSSSSAPSSWFGGLFGGKQEEQTPKVKTEPGARNLGMYRR